MEYLYKKTVTITIPYSTYIDCIVNNTLLSLFNEYNIDSKCITSINTVKDITYYNEYGNILSNEEVEIYDSTYLSNLRRVIRKSIVITVDNSKINNSVDLEKNKYL